MARPNLSQRRSAPSGAPRRAGGTRSLVTWLRGFTLDALVVWGSVWLCVPPPPRAERAIVGCAEPPASGVPGRAATAPLTYDERCWQAELNGS